MHRFFLHKQQLLQYLALLLYHVIYFLNAITNFIHSHLLVLYYFILCDMKIIVVSTGYPSLPKITRGPWTKNSYWVIFAIFKFCINFQNIKNRS